MTKTTLIIISIFIILLMGSSYAYWNASSISNKAYHYIHQVDLSLYTHRGVVSTLEKEVEEQRSVNEQIAAIDQMFGGGDELSALAEYQELLKQDPSNMELLLRMGIIYLQKEEYSLAQEHLSTVYGFKASIFSMDAAWFLALLNVKYEQWDNVKPLLQEIVDSRGNYHLQAKELLNCL